MHFSYQCEYADDFANTKRLEMFFYKIHKHSSFLLYVFVDEQSTSIYEQNLYHKIHIEIVWTQSVTKQYDISDHPIVENFAHTIHIQMVYLQYVIDYVPRNTIFENSSN